MDFNKVLELLREGQSPAWIIDNWWKDLAKENNIGEVTAKELATRQVATAQQVIAAQDKGYTPIGALGEEDIITEGDTLTTEGAEIRRAIAERGGGGLIYRNADAIIALSDAAKPPGYTDADIKKSIEGGQGWDPTFGRWYEKDEYLAELDKNLDVVTDPWRLSQIKGDANKNWDNDKAVTVDLEKITRPLFPDTWGVKKITDLPTGEAPTVAGEEVTPTPSAAVAPSAAASAPTVTAKGGGAATTSATADMLLKQEKEKGLLDTGLDIDKLSKLGVTPAQMARGLPTMLPGGTSPFVARGYSSILQNYTEIFPMIALAGLVPGFEVGEGMDATMAMANLDNPQVFAAFIKQKPEDIAKDIKTTLELLESAKELNAASADGEWGRTNSTTTKGLLLAHFVNEPDQYNRIGGKELALRQTLGRMGKPRWLGDLISNQLEKKYSQQLLSNPDSITEPGFYSNAFANLTTPNPELTKEIIKGGAPAAQAGASSKTPAQIREAGAKAAADLGLKSFIPGVEPGSIDMEKDLYPDLYKTSATDTATDTTAKTWDDDYGQNPVEAGFYKDRTNTSFTPTPEGAIAQPGGGFIDPTTYGMDPQEYQDYLAEQREGMTLVPGSGYANLGEFQQVIDTPDGGKRIIDTRSPYDVRTPGTYDPVTQPLKTGMGYEGQIPGMAPPIKKTNAQKKEDDAVDIYLAEQGEWLF